MSVDVSRFVAAYRDTKKNTAEFVRVVNAARVSGTENKAIFIEIRDALLAAGEIPAKSLENSISHYSKAGQLASIAKLDFEDDVALHAAWQISTGRVKSKEAAEFASEFGTKRFKNRTESFVKGVKSLINSSKDESATKPEADESETEGEGEGVTSAEPKPVSIDRMLEAIRKFVASSTDDEIESVRIDLIADSIRKGQADRKEAPESE